MQNRPGGPQFRGGEPPRRDYVSSPAYLKDGYFDERGNPRPQILTSDADQVAEDFFRRGLTYSQVRKPFNKAKSIEYLLDSKRRFEDEVWRITTLKRDVADAAGRNIGLDVLKTFIDRNVPLAVESEAHFRKGFLQHFQSVMAYFRYRHPRE